MVSFRVGGSKRTAAEEMQMLLQPQVRPPIRLHAAAAKNNCTLLCCMLLTMAGNFDQQAPTPGERLVGVWQQVPPLPLRSHLAGKTGPSVAKKRDG